MKRSFWSNDKIDILTTYLRNGNSQKDIAKKLNTSVDSVSGAIRRYNLNEHIIIAPTSTKFLKNIDFNELNDKNFEQTKKEAKLKWNIAKSNREKTKNKNFEIGLFFPDAHIPHHNMVVCKSILKLMDDILFDKFVIIGDFLDFGCISHWNKNKHKTLELQRLKNDYIEGNSFLDEIDKRLPKNCEKHYLFGNHDGEWPQQLLEEMPQLEGLVEPESQLFLKERHYKTYSYNELVQFGRLYVTHGIYAGANPIKKHLDELKVNVLFGHTHSLGMMLSSSPAREIAFAGYNIGAVCDLSPDYMKNKPNAWQHGFAVGYFYPNGYFDIQIVRIIDGRFVFNGKIYDGNEK